MASVQDIFKNNSVQAIAIGLGAAILAPVLLPALAKVAKPLGRAAIKAGILAYEKGKETVAEMGEVFDDLVAEAKAELEQSGHHVVSPAPAAAAETAEQAVSTTTNETPAG